jgi:hypothetical protein
MHRVNSKVSTHCTGLQSLNLKQCNEVTDVSLIAVAHICSGMQSLRTNGCDGLSSDKLHYHEFKSVYELRAIDVTVFLKLISISSKFNSSDLIYIATNH